MTSDLFSHMIPSFRKRMSDTLCHYSRRHSHLHRKFSSSDNVKITPKAFEKHTKLISALVINQPGTLAKIASAFAQDNITTLSVVPTVVPEISRVTIVATLTAEGNKLLRRRLQRLVAVTFLHTKSLDEKDYNRSQAFIRVKIQNKEAFHTLKNLLNDYKGEIIAKNEKSVLCHAVNEDSEITTLVSLIQKEQSLTLEEEVVKSGPVFMSKLESTLSDNSSVTNPVQVVSISEEDSTTQDIHTNLIGSYSPDRLTLHARIAQQLYDTGPENLHHPTFILLVGIPGSGKSTILRTLDSTWRSIDLESFINFDVDECLSLLPEFYQSVLNIGMNATHCSGRAIPSAHARYRMCQDEARFIVKKNRDLAIMNRKNIILHSSGKSFDTNASLLLQVNAAGYDSYVVCVDVDTEVAIKRVSERSGKFAYGRDVPTSVIYKAARNITTNFPKLAAIAKHSLLYDSAERPPALVWSTDDDYTEHKSVFKKFPLLRSKGRTVWT